MKIQMMEKVRIVHSWWSLPMCSKRWNVETKEQVRQSLIMGALSVQYAKNNGCYVVCHCDTYMLRYVNCLGYDEVICDLDGIEDDFVCSDCTLVWAAGKFYAMLNEPLGTIHIDFDVFLTKPEVVNQLRFAKGEDIIYSHIETSDNYRERELLKDKIPTCDMTLDVAANVGVIGFNNQYAKDDYFSHYLHYFKTLQYDTNGDKDLNADLILEQTYLYQMLHKYNTRNLIGDQSKDTPFVMQKRAVDIGFQHVMGRAKYSKFMARKMRERLANINKDILEQIDKLYII